MEEEVQEGGAQKAVVAPTLLNLVKMVFEMVVVEAAEVVNK